MMRNYAAIDMGALLPRSLEYRCGVPGGSNPREERFVSVETVRNDPDTRAAAYRAPTALETPLPAAAQKALTFGLVLSAVRCTLQYVLLPFVLPWVGLAASIPP